MATPTLERIAREIHSLEGIEVRLKPLNGAIPTRAPKYVFARGARNNSTVADWKRLRFEKKYADLGLAVEVVLGNGKVATPATPLERVRRSYEAAPAKAATGTKKQPTTKRASAATKSTVRRGASSPAPAAARTAPRRRSAKRAEAAPMQQAGESAAAPN